MKAILLTQYGSPDVLQFKEVEKPTPKDGEILVKIHAASANPLDWHLMRASRFFIRLGSNHRAAGSARYGTDPARAKGSGEWRVWWGGDLCRADCQSIRDRSDWRVQHAEPGSGPLDWRRPRHRLHARRFPQESAALCDMRALKRFCCQRAKQEVWHGHGTRNRAGSGDAG